MWNFKAATVGAIGQALVDLGLAFNFAILQFWLLRRSFANAAAAVRGTLQAISGNLNRLTLYPGLYKNFSIGRCVRQRTDHDASNTDNRSHGVNIAREIIRLQSNFDAGSDFILVDGLR